MVRKVIKALPPGYSETRAPISNIKTLKNKNTAKIMKYGIDFSIATFFCQQFGKVFHLNRKNFSLT